VTVEKSATAAFIAGLLPAKAKAATGRAVALGADKVWLELSLD
jgi:hypothetical protein